MLKPMLTKVSESFGDKVDYVYMDIDSFPELAEMLEIQHIPKTFMIFKGDLVDQFGGVPQDDTKIQSFFQRAAELAEEKGEWSENRWFLFSLMVFKKFDLNFQEI